MAPDRLKKVEDELAALRQRLKELEMSQGSSPGEAPEGDGLEAADAEEWVEVEEPGGSWEPLPGQPAPPERDLESQIGAKVVAIVGLGVLVLGAVFFLNLAFSRGWIGLAGRIYLGLAAGAALWVLGGFLHKARRLEHYGQVVSAAGASIVYLVVFVGHQVERYQEATGIPTRVGLLLAGLVALILVVDAGLRRAPWLASLSIPLMVITVAFTKDWSTFAVPYVVVLTAAVLAASAWRRWSAVALASVPSSFLTLLVALYVPDAPAMHVFVGSLLLLALHVAIGVRAPPHPTVAVGQPLAWAAAWGLILVSLERLVTEEWLDRSMGLWTLGLALAALALVAVRTASPQARWSWAGTGVVLFLAWPPLLFDGSPVAWIWTATLAALVLVHQIAAQWATRHFRPRIVADVVQYAAFAVAGLVTLRLMFWEARSLNGGEPSLLEGIPLFVLAIGVLFSGWFVSRLQRSGMDFPEEGHLAFSILVSLAFLWAVLTGPGVSLAWAGVAVTLIAAGFAFRGTDLRVAGLAVLAVVLGRIVFVDLADVDTVWRVLTFIGFGLILLGVAYAHTRLRRSVSAHAAEHQV